MDTTESKASSSRAAPPQSGDVAIVVDKSPHLRAGEKEELREEAAELLEDLNAFYSRSPAITERALELTASTLNRRKSFALSHSRLSNTSAPDSSREDVHTRSQGPDHGGENGAPSQPLLADHRRSEMLGLAARYESLLQSLGHSKEAQRVAEFWQGVKEVSAANGVAPGGGAQDDADLLTGMEALLKDGLVRFLMTVKPFLPPFPSQIVKFTDVKYSTLLPIDDTPYDDMLTKFVPCLRKKVPTERVPVLSGVTGYLMPGSLTLCLGPLASGQTALTKILGGRSWVDKKTWHQSGCVTYNGKNLREVQISRLASYAGPYPNHHPALTVRETLEFARDCSQAFKPWHSEDLQEALGLPKGSKARADAKTDLIIKVLGLKAVEHVPVGALTPDELRRLSIGEMRAGTYTVHLHDDVGVDFDPALAFDIVSMLKATSRVFQTVQWVACDNLSSEVYNQFDRVVVLNGGRIVYQGPRLDALLYFERLGYFKPQHVEVADYLMEVTTADGHQYLRPGAQALDVDGFVAEYEQSQLYQDVRRIAESEKSRHVYWMKLTDPSQVAFEDADVSDDGGKTIKTLPAISWLDDALVSECSLDRTSEPHLGDVVSGVRIGNETFRYLAVGDHDSSAAGLMVALKGAEGDVWLQLERPLSKVDGVLPRQWTQKYVQPFWPSTRRVLHRQWLVTIRNKTAIKARLIQVIILGIFAGTLLYQKSLRPPTTVLLGLRKAAPFIAILVIFLGALAQVPGQMVERAIYYKHHAQGFYRASSYVLAAFACNAPLVAMEVLVYGCLLYFLTGGSLYDHWAPIFVFLVLLYMSGTIGASMVRMLTSCLESAAAVNQIAGILIGLFIVFAGFLIPLHIMPNWWFWFYYLSPMQWIITGLMINEFRSGRYDQICGDYPPALLAVLPYCRGANLNKSVGEAYLDFNSIQYRKWWLGICFAVLVVFVLGFQFLAWLGLKYVSFPEKLNQRISLAGFLQTRRFGKRAEVPQPTEWQTVQPPKANGSEHAGHTAEALVVKAAALPAFQPVTLSWHDVSSEVPIPNFKDPRVVLSHVSGWAKPGTMTAIMGVKGSGKTVLMDILAGRNTPGRTKGSILVNGYPRDVDTFRRVRGYVSPSDVHPAYATVRECVQFSAKLRLPRNTTPEKREALVSEVLTLTGLAASAAHLVGTPGTNGLDPEQLRRLSLAVGLVTNPAVNFVDEPDKNLDPQAARRIVACNHAVAKSGRTVISTLNHPVGRILGVFDRLLLLKRGGETTYWGPVGGLACTDAVGYFERIPGTLPCGFSENPADYLIECIGGGLRQRTDRDYSFDYRHSVLAAESAAELRVLRRSKGQAGPNLVEKGYAAPMSTIYKEVLLRAQRTYFRNLSYSFGRVTSAILLGLIFGSVFWQMPYTTIVRSGARGGVIYISTLLMTIGSATVVILELNKERPVYDRERSHRMYPALAWSLGWGLAEIPYIAVSFLFHCAILCLMTNIATDSAASFFEFWFTLCLFGATIVYAAMFLAVATPAPQIAIVIINVFINLMIASAGYVIPKAQIPRFWQFAYWINPARYTLNSLRSIAFYCDTKSRQCTTPGCASNPAVCPACTCTRLKDNFNVFVWTSQQSSAQLDNGRRLWDWMALLAFCVFFRVLAYLALRRAKFNNKY